MPGRFSTNAGRNKYAPLSFSPQNPLPPFSLRSFAYTHILSLSLSCSLSRERTRSSTSQFLPPLAACARCRAIFHSSRHLAAARVREACGATNNVRAAQEPVYIPPYSWRQYSQMVVHHEDSLRSTFIREPVSHIRYTMHFCCRRRRRRSAFQINNTRIHGGRHGRRYQRFLVLQPNASTNQSRYIRDVSYWEPHPRSAADDGAVSFSPVPDRDDAPAVR